MIIYFYQSYLTKYLHTSHFPLSEYISRPYEYKFSCFHKRLFRLSSIFPPSSYLTVIICTSKL